MATDLKNVAVGLADVQIAAWASNDGATGYTSVGILKNPPEETISATSYQPEFESLPGSVISSPIGLQFTVKVDIAESTPDWLQVALQQPAANLTGSTPNKTLLVGDPEEQYKSIKLVTKGGTGATGTRATRTITYHRCAVTKVEPRSFAKGKEQIIGVTFQVLYDTTISAANKYMKQIDSGGA